MSEPQAARAARAREYGRAAAEASGVDGREAEALAGWAQVRETLRARPRVRELAALHLEAHRRPLEIAGAAPLDALAAERVWEDGVALARELGRGAAVPRLELAFAVFQLLRGLDEAARVHARRARDVGDLLGDPPLAARGAAALAAADLAGARERDPADLRERLAALAERAGDAPDPDAAGAAGRAALERALAWESAAGGDLEAALRGGARALEAARGTDLLARTGAEHAWLLTRAGRPETAREAARAALAAVPHPDAEGARAAALGVLALAELACGRPEAAARAGVQAADRARVCGIREDPWLPLPWIAAECLAACGAPDAASARLVEAGRTPGLRETRTRRLHEARALARLGRAREAERARARARALHGADPLARVPDPGPP